MNNLLLFLGCLTIFYIGWLGGYFLGYAQAIKNTSIVTGKDAKRFKKEVHKK